MATTLAQCQQLAAAIAAIAAPYLEQELLAGAVVTRQYASECIQPASNTAPGSNAATAANVSGGYTGPDPAAIHLTAQNGAAISPTSFVNTLVEVPGDAPVAALLADAGFLNDTVRNMAKQLADRVEADLLALYPSFSVNAAVGTSNSAITDANILIAAQELEANHLVSSAQRYLFLANGVAASGRATWEDFLALANITDQTKVGSGTANSGYLLRNAPLYRGFRVIPSNNITRTGGGSVNTKNVCFAGPQAFVLVFGNEADLNDATHVQQLSLSSSTAPLSAVHVRIAASGSDTVRMALRCAYGVAIGRNGYGLLFQT